MSTADRITEARHACALGAMSLRATRSGATSRLHGRWTSGELGRGDRSRRPDPGRGPLSLDTRAGGDHVRGPAGRRLAGRSGRCLPRRRGRSARRPAALQRVGEVTCTLGEIKNRADLIVVWRADPLESHPRLFSRYALDPPGAFLPGGRSDRYCVVVDAIETRTVREAADQFIAIEPDGYFAALWVLRALARGIESDAAEVEATTGSRAGDVATVAWIG